MLRGSAIALLCCVAACGGADSPLDRHTGQARIVRQVGPGGAVLRGDAGTPLEGFLLDIPEAALGRLVEVVVEPGTDIALPDSNAVSRSFVIRATPDPGILLRAASLRVAFELPLARRPNDLFVASRPLFDEPTFLAQPGRRLGIAAAYGVYDSQTKVFEAPLRALTEVQVRASARPRLDLDAIRLVQSGYDRFARLTDEGLGEADALFTQAQQADPFAGAPNLFRAASRLLVVLNDRADVGPGIDSIGEALQRIGFDLSGRSLIDLVRTGDWPTRIDVPTDAPTARDVLELLRARLRPVLEQSAVDLDRVPPTTDLVISLPSPVRALPGDRELDATDIVFFRALIDGVAFLLEHLGDYDLDAQPRSIVPRTGPQPSLRAVLDRFPGLAVLRTAPGESSNRALRATLFLLASAFSVLDAEEDAQDNDLLVFPRSFDAVRRDTWRADLAALQRSLDEDVEQRLAFEDGTDSLFVRFGGPWRAGLVSPRAFVPELFRFVPLAGTLPDPTAGGLLPRMTQDRATNMLRFASFHAAPHLSIVADGALGDWTPAAEALAPSDPTGDVRAGSLAAIDLRQVWFAEGDEELAFRLGVVDGAIGFRGEQAAVYGFVLRDVTETGFGAPTVIEVHVQATGLDVRVRQRGSPVPVRATAAAIGADLELTLNRFDLLDPDEPVVDRAIEAFAEGLDLRDGTVARDRARPFLVRF